MRLTLTPASAYIIAATVLIMPVAGCAATPTSSQASATGSPSMSTAPALSDDEAQAQVVALGREIVQATQLQGVKAGFEFSSCNDQGDPPYKGWLQIAFDIPAGANPADYIKHIATTMQAQGWSAGPPANQSYVGTVISKGGIAAQLGGPTSVSPKATIDIYGECRNMTNHHNDNKTNGGDIVKTCG